MKRNNPNKMNMILLCVTAVTATLAAVVIALIHAGVYTLDHDSHLTMPLFMGLVFALLLLVSGLTVFGVSVLRGNYRADVITGKSRKGRVTMYLLCCGLVMVAFIFGAEFLYEANVKISAEESCADTYVFLIDDSGTMFSNDPDNLRYDAIESILKGKPDHTQYTVYSFSSEGKLVVPLRTVADGFVDYPEPEYMQTNMKSGLEVILDDLKNGVWTNNGNTELIMITDGAPTDFIFFYEVESVLDRLVAENIPLGIIGVIGADNNLMEKMAAHTGGTFVDISDISQLNEAIREVSGDSRFTRDLLSERDNVNAEWLYALIRILAISIAGAIIAACAALCYGNSTAVNFIFWANTIKSVFAGILMEIAFQVPLLSSILCIAALAILGTILAKEGENGELEVGKPDYLELFDKKNKKTTGFSID